MDLITLDFESFWSQTHSLSKMLPMSYVTHPDTDIISCSVKINDQPTQCYFGDEVDEALKQIEWSQVMALAHNMSAFDAMILAWRYGIRPRMWGCTLAMARPLHGSTVGGSLGKLVAHYAPQLKAMGISPVKDNTVLVQTQGKRLKDFTADEIARMRTYNKDDTDQCWGLFQLMRKHFTTAELWQIDATVRMLVEPGFDVDKALLETALSVERTKKHEALLEVAKDLRVPAHEVSDLDIDPKDGANDLNWHDEAAVAEFVRGELASSAKFSKLLERYGVPVPMKPSPTDPENKRVPALAKTDQGFLDLMEHEDPKVATAARARLAVKSTLLETRIGAFLESAQACKGKLPITLHYCGANTTGRWSGWAYNPQNLPRIDPKKPRVTDALRKSLKAPPGYKVGVADSSGIELRVNMHLWKVPYAMELFKASPDKADLYRYFAAHELYGKDEDAIDKNERQVGKVSHLGLGFGAGWETFQKVAKNMAGIVLPDDEADKIVITYRRAHMEIVRGWKTCHNALQLIHDGIEAPIDPWGLCHTEKDAIRLPSGRRIRYPGLHKETRQVKDKRTGEIKTQEEWWYGEGRNRARIYGPKVVENIVQALARDALADYSLQFFKETGLRPKLLVHDEYVGLWRGDKAQQYLDLLQQIMRTPLSWWPELITWSEGDLADTYGAAK